MAKGSVPAASTRMDRTASVRGRSCVMVRPRGAKRMRNQRWWITPGSAAMLGVGSRNSRADSPRGCTERPDQRPPRHSPLTDVWTAPATSVSCLNRSGVPNESVFIATPTRPSPDEMFACATYAASAEGGDRRMLKSSRPTRAPRTSREKVPSSMTTTCASTRGTWRARPRRVARTIWRIP
ncbi:MAG: hypothetical protein RL139_1485 [Gemmatimonadota bacterium]|jgi:hypothetical protein